MRKFEQSKGFLLTSDWRDGSTAHSLHFLGVGEIGPFELILTQERPYFFVERGTFIPHLSSFQRKTSELRNFQHHFVDVLEFNNQRNLNEVATLLAQKGVRTFESDLRPDDRFLMERLIRRNVEFSGEGEWRNGIWRLVNPTMLASYGYSPQLKTLSLDIETSRQGTVYSIAMELRGQRKVIFLGKGEDIPPWRHDEISRFLQENSTLSKVTTLELIPAISERELLQKFLKVYQEMDPDILIGWNVVGFDLLHLKKRFERHSLSFLLGRGGTSCQIRERGARKDHYASMKGRVVVDGISALRANFFQFENFKLETVARQVLGRGKAIDQQADKQEEVERLFTHDLPALLQYNIMDTVLVSEIFEKLDLLSLILTKSQLTGLSLERVGSSIAMFDFLYLPELHRRGFVASNALDRPELENVPGGHVLDPLLGLYDNVIVFDFKSLYPSIIRTFKIDPLSKVQAAMNPLPNPVGGHFSGTEHILPAMIEDLMDKRADARREGKNSLALGIKIIMNSFYGVMGATGSRFYHPELPRAITGIGRWVLLTSRDYFQEKGHQVLYGDTDSLFLVLKEKGWSRERTIQEGHRLALELNSYLQNKIAKEYQAESKLEVVFEKFYRKFFLPHTRGGKDGAKKRYVGMKVELELDQTSSNASIIEKGEKLHFVGMEFVRSDWTALAKKFQYGLFQMIFQDFQDFQVQDPKENILMKKIEAWIRDFVGKLQGHEFDGDLVYRKRLTKNLAEYTKTRPPHVKAAQLLPDAFLGPREIQYVMTLRGPIPIELSHADIDYHHYIEKQLRPIAESILSHLGIEKSFDEIWGPEEFLLPF